MPRPSKPKAGLTIYLPERQEAGLHKEAQERDVSEDKLICDFVELGLRLNRATLLRFLMEVRLHGQEQPAILFERVFGYKMP